MSKQCAVCGGTAQIVSERTEFRIGNRSAVIAVERVKCDDCQEVVYTPEQAEAAFRRASDAIRQQEGLLSAASIKAIRNRFRLTQAQLEQLLNIGPKTIVRWERGTIFQTKAADELLRCLDAVPGVFEHLAARSGLASQEVAATNNQSAKIHVDDRGGASNITNINEFKSARQTVVSVSEETEMPDIPEEAMK